MNRILSKFCILALFFFSLTSTAFTTESQPQGSTAHKSVGAQAGAHAGKKGGIYKVGRGFKYAGHEMKQGFKAAGRGFKHAGHSMHNFFTGESDKKETKSTTTKK